MNNLIVSIFGNKVFLEILEELNLFKNTEIKFIDNGNDDIIRETSNKNIIIFFLNEKNVEHYSKLKNKELPILLVNNGFKPIKKAHNFFEDQIIAPFKIENFEKKIVAILAKQKFKKSSLIELGQYKINKNEKKIKKGDIELKLTEKEINFLIFFASNKSPVSKNFILKNLWNYAADSDTHTIETHIHRLRKKILKKFNDNNFIKNNNEGYYI